MQNLILNRYRLLDVAGAGGYGTVHVAWDTRIQRRVAIKSLRLDAFAAPGAAVSVREIPGLEEARTAAMLSDQHIVGVYDFEVEGGLAYLIMEYMDGITLTDLMRMVDGPLPLDVLTCVFEAVAHALEVAHDNQVLHLDIKPDNVLVNRQGQVKVADFGLAQLSHEAGYGRAAGGTIGYMPLEQMRLEPPDVRTDEWALAALTYQMLTGDNPFSAPDLASAARAIEQAEIVIPSLARGDVGEEADEAVFGALAIDRADRFASVSLFADALLPHLGDARRGARMLAAFVGDACADDEEGLDGAGEGPAVSDSPRAAARIGRTAAARLSGRGGAIAARVVSGAVCATTAFVGLAAAGAGGLALPAAAGSAVLLPCALVAAAIGAFFPRAGSLAVLVCVACGLAIRGSLVAAAVFAVAMLWWFAGCGRRGAMQAVAGAAVVAASSLGALSLVPLIAAYCLRVRDALGTTLFAVAAAFAAAFGGVGALSGGGLFAGAGPAPAVSDTVSAMVARLADPGAWAVVVSWMAAAAVGAALCSGGGRVRAASGMAAAVALLVCGLMARAFVTSGYASYAPEAADMAVLAVAGAAAVALAAWLGAPSRDGSAPRAASSVACEYGEPAPACEAPSPWPASSRVPSMRMPSDGYGAHRR